jgi:hypothetical protein
MEKSLDMEKCLRQQSTAHHKSTEYKSLLARDLTIEAYCHNMQAVAEIWTWSHAALDKGFRPAC